MRHSCCSRLRLLMQPLGQGFERRPRFPLDSSRSSMFDNLFEDLTLLVGQVEKFDACLLPTAPHHPPLNHKCHRVVGKAEADGYLLPSGQWAWGSHGGPTFPGLPLESKTPSRAASHPGGRLLFRHANGCARGERGMMLTPIHPLPLLKRAKDPLGDKVSQRENSVSRFHIGDNRDGRNSP